MHVHVYSMHMHLIASGGPSMQRYENKVVLITGGGGGIGKAAARRFLEEGARVVLSGTRAAKLEAARAELEPPGDRVAIHRDLPHRALPRAERGALRGGAELDPAPHLLGIAGGGRGDERARRRRDRQRRLDVGGRRDR